MRSGVDSGAEAAAAADEDDEEDDVLCLDVTAAEA
jgi:hypothetical protein